MKMKSRSGMWTMFLVGLVLCFQAISAMAASTTAAAPKAPAVAPLTVTGAIASLDAKACTVTIAPV